MGLFLGKWSSILLIVLGLIMCRKSKLVWSRDVRNRILSCFKPPFSKPDAQYSNPL